MIVSLIKRPIYAGYGRYNCPHCGKPCSDYPGEHELCPSCGTPLKWGQECRYCNHSYWDNGCEQWHCNVLDDDVPYTHSCLKWESRSAILAFHPYPIRDGIYACGRCHTAFSKAWQQRKTCPWCGMKNSWKKSCYSCKYMKMDHEVLKCTKHGSLVGTSNVCDEWEEKLRIFTEAKNG